MDKEQVINAARALVRAGRAFVLATVDQQGAPQTRWMGAALLEEPFTLYMVASANSRKMGQMAANPNAQLAFQTEDFSEVATLSGPCELVSDAQTKRRVWDGIPASAEYFAGPDDPGFGVIRLTCRRIELLRMAEGESPAVAEL